MRILLLWLMMFAALAGCVDTVEEGAATGGLGGAAVGALAGGPIGAAIGAGVGAAGGGGRPEGGGTTAPGHSRGITLILPLRSR